MSREAVRGARRLVVKVGSSSLTTAGGGLDPDRLGVLVDALAGRSGEMVLVSSGAIAAGLAPLGLVRRPRDLATSQAAASVGQSKLVQAYAGAFARHGRTVAQVLLTADDVGRRAHYRNAQTTLERLLALGVVPVVNENDAVATAEIRFGDNDRLAALVAHLVRADALVLLSDVDGLYDGDPRRPGARLLADVRDERDLEGVEAGGTGAAGVGSGGMASKVDAARIATAAGVPVLLGAAVRVLELLDGVGGTCFAATGSRRGRRLLWLAHASTPIGRLHLDAGAVRAVAERGSSLLPAGVVAVEGDFAAGDPVELCGPDGRGVARGLVAYDAAELPALLGRSTRESGVREVVHRDDLVVLAPRARGRAGRMTTAWIVPAGTDRAPEAQPGDYLLRRDGDRIEVGHLGEACTWVGSLDASLLPQVPAVDAPTRAPEQEAVLTAARGLESAETHRGG